MNINNLPMELQMRALANQEFQGNKRDTKACLYTPSQSFCWDKSTEGPDFWEEIAEGNFNVVPLEYRSRITVTSIDRELYESRVETVSLDYLQQLSKHELITMIEDMKIKSKKFEDIFEIVSSQFPDSPSSPNFGKDEMDILTVGEQVSTYLGFL